MDIHAYPTDARTPVDQTEATRLAAAELPAPAPWTERHVAEFDTGFVVYDARPQRAAAGRAQPVGGSVYVIDRATGAVSFWPSYPCAVIAELYAARRVVVADGWPEQDE
ncbi:hypothetical protein [Nocardia rhizosphaerae]|uniref:Uncharacterized protein n=1 Tax=Nocardia rhizosphaerae TaxID=1691571 RepID=A0ABV8L6Y6_9NOCA